MLQLHLLHVQEGPRARGTNINFETFSQPSLPKSGRPAPREYREIETEDAAGPPHSPGVDAHADIKPSPATAGMRRRTGKVHADSQPPSCAPGPGMRASHGMVTEEAGASGSTGLPSFVLRGADAPASSPSQPAQHGTSSWTGMHA